MEKEYPKSIFELIDSEHFRKRPGLYIGGNSISKLRLFMNGYEICELFNGIKSINTKPPFWLFLPWIVNFYNHYGLNYNWDRIILQNCENDEEKSLKVFFERFDEFKKLEPFKISKCQLDKKAIEFFHSSKSKRFTLEEGEEIIIGPVQELYIVEYAQEFGSTIHHRVEDKGIHSGYYKTTEEAINSAEREYGQLLVWEEVSVSDIEKIYEKINQ